MSFKGQITTVLRNAQTLQAEGEEVVKNIITESFYDYLIDTLSITGLQIVISGMRISPNRWQALMPVNGSGNFLARPDAAIPGQSSVQFFPKTETTPAFLQYAARYNPPTVPRTIRSVALVAPTGPYANYEFDWLLNNSPDAITSMAYSPLNSDCVQTSSQVLDLYYRIFFPEDTSDAVTSSIMVELATSIGNSNMMSVHSLYPTPVVTKAKAGDENRHLTASIAHIWSHQNAIVLNTNTVRNPLSPAKRLLNWDSVFTNTVGRIYSSIISGGLVGGTRGTSGAPYLLKAGNGFNEVPVTLAANVLKSNRKVQNLIGHGTTGKPDTASPWLDVDNLPNGGGRVTLGETWNNYQAPIAPGLYSKTLLPQWNTIAISASGNVGGTASYLYKKQIFFGLTPSVVNGSYGNSTNRTASAYGAHALPSLCATAPAVDAPANIWKWYQTDAGKNLVEEITPAYFDTEQLSACIKYDETSLILVKKNFILLYSVGAGDYWKFKGPFTNIHQVAVVNGDIYIACRDTGLYKVSPAQSLNVVPLTTPAAGIDLSRCFGVAKGYGNSVWAVGVNGLVSLISGVWKKYNETSTPAFNLSGVSDDNWSNIAYLKVDEYSVDYQMHLVRRIGASVDATYFGIWWSTQTSAENSFEDVTVASFGRPRVNRAHFGGQEGLWAVINDSHHRVMAFNAITPVAVVGSATITANKIGLIYSSVCFVHNAAGQVRLLIQEPMYVTDTSGWSYTALRASLSNSSGVLEETAETALSFAVGTGGDWYDLSGMGNGQTRTRASSAAGYGYYDAAASIILDKGVMVALWCGTNLATNFDDYDGPGSMDNFLVSVSNYGLGPELNGGGLGYLASRKYGWNGSSWVEDLVTPKPAHGDFQELLEGVQVKFENGGAGASFATPNYYRFGLCEGILKDNATRHNVQLSFYSRRKVARSGELSAYVVPALSAQPTGAITLNTTRTSADVHQDGQGNIVFPAPAGLQIAYSVQQVTGDFEVSYNATMVRESIESRILTQFGVGKVTQGAAIMGFHLSSGNLYINTGDSYYFVTSDYTSLNTLGIVREGDTFKFLVNGVVARTSAPNASKIYAADSRLELIALAVSGSQPALLLPNRRCPATTIVSNGSDRAVFIGNANNATGYYNLRFYGIDTDDRDNSVTLNGVSAVLKYDGTAPLAGEVTIDAVSGILYFHASDEGKPIACKLSYFKSE